jgi:hypothetical protein
MRSSIFGPSELPDPLRDSHSPRTEKCVTFFLQKLSAATGRVGARSRTTA